VAFSEKKRRKATNYLVPIYSRKKKNEKRKDEKVKEKFVTEE